MTARSIRIWLVGLVTVFALLQVASVEGVGPGPDPCAFEDVNDNGIKDGGDIDVADAAWIGGAAFVSKNPFVVPMGCNKTLVSGLAVTQGVRVTATKITFLGKLEYIPVGGRGVVFIADPAAVGPAPGLGNGDLFVGNGALIRAGGHNALPATEIAVARRSVALVGTGKCTFHTATILGNSPIQDTEIGIRCTGDMSFRSTTVFGSKVNIQSLLGEIDAGQGAVGGGLLTLLQDLCDDPATNGAGNGNGNGVSDAGDFPCSPALNLNAPDRAVAVCAPFSVDGGNTFHAFNDPLIMVAGAGAGNNLDVQGASIVGRYRVTLAAEDGNLLTQGATIDHGEQLGLTPPGGAKIWLFANPTTVVRLPVDREDFLGPSTGSTDITGACYRSPNPVQVGRDGGGAINLNGTPDPACLQNPPDFVPVLNGNF